MPKPLTILGIETSCDETSAAIVRAHNNGLEILSNVTASQVPIHRKYGGVVPEVAARNHVVTILPTIEHALTLAGISPTLILPLHGRGRKSFFPPPRGGKIKMGGQDIDAIAVTSGPGLMVALQVGVETAKTLAYVWNKPLIRVNHLVGHVYANWLTPDVSLRGVKTTKQSLNQIATLPAVARNDIFPVLALIVSGGHTELVLMKRHLHFKKIGATLDDAAGEAFDKIGSLLGLPYPAGPEIDRLAKTGNPEAVNLPRPMINTPDFNFSFAGLKTAALYTLKGSPSPQSPPIKGGEMKNSSPLMGEDKGGGEAQKSDFAASVQKAIVDVLVAKTIRAAKQYKVKTVLLAGGVAANNELRTRLGEEIKKSLNAVCYTLPPKNLTTDNGAMIAAAGYFMYLAKKFTPWQEIKADPNWELP